MTTSLQQLADQNLSGFSFLVAYGLTWIVCGVLWTRASERIATFATLFQGLVALPIALSLSVAIGAIGRDRPVNAEITQLSLLIGTSQLLGLPLLIFLVVTNHDRIVPFAFATITSMHFVLYSWLYRTGVYIVLALLIALGTMVLMLAAPQGSRSAPARVSFLTGGLLLSTGLLFALLHLG